MNSDTAKKNESLLSRNSHHTRWSAPMHIPRGQAFDATVPHFYECSMGDANYLEVWCYTDHMTYAPGDEVIFHTSTTAKEYSIEIIHDGFRPQSVYKVEVLPGSFHKTPEDFYEKGCGWPEAHRWRIPDDQASGFYMVVSRVVDESGVEREHEHGFIVRPGSSNKRAKILLIAATSTWTAYNDWGGTNNYVGLHGETDTGLAPRLHLHRPWTRGLIYVPEGAPRKPHEYDTRPGYIPRNPSIEFAFTRGYSKWYASAGWGSFEFNFIFWAQQNGYELDLATQVDLHYRPQLLEGYPCVITTGHDEYWSLEMRQALDKYVENGGNFARFGGNFCWQVRLEDEGLVQVSYKHTAHELDPVRETEQVHLLTTLWEDPKVGLPGAQSVGVNGMYGVYARVGGIAPRHCAGFTTYRSEHWALQGTDLCYGDVFGSEAHIFGYEVDGLDYIIEDGLPEPTYRDGALPGTEIIAMGLAGNSEQDHGHKGTVHFYGAFDDAVGIANIRYGEGHDRKEGSGKRGNGMIVAVPKGKGQIFCAGTCEWVNGLKLRDVHTEIITRNVLDRFTSM